MAPEMISRSDLKRRAARVPAKLRSWLRHQWHALRVLWTAGGVPYRVVARRVATASWRDDVLSRAAELAYWFLFSTFPLLLFLVALFGYVLEGSDELRRTLFRYIAQVSPSPDVTDLLRTTLEEVLERRGGAKLSIGLAAALWVASTGIVAIGKSLNVACNLEETRSWWRMRASALLLTIAFAGLIVTALVLVLYGGQIGSMVDARMAWGSFSATTWSFLQWPFVLFFVLLAFEVIYNFAPNLQRCDRVWLTPGAVVAMALWIGASLGFRVYLTQFAYYSKTYGSLGVVIILLLWFYLAGIAILLGGEVNSELARAVDEGRRTRED